MEQGIETIQLSDMLESYPSPMTPGFQTLITAKKEFQEAASFVGEKKPKGKGFQPFAHQKATHRFLRAYKDLLILSETGTGKSCEVLGFTEYAREELEKAKVNPANADEKAGHFKRVIVLVKGPAQKNEFRNQLACKCSDGNYVDNDLVKKAGSETTQKKNLTHMIKKAGYYVTTYQTFATYINKHYTELDDERIAEDYSDVIFWVDEGHNLIVDDSGKRKKKKKDETYHTIWRVFHLARRSKRIISTATPMINTENELGSLLNLILPRDGDLPTDYDYRNAPGNDIRVLFPKLPYNPETATYDQMADYFRGQFPQDYDFKTATLRDLEPFMRGRVGFIRANNTGAIPVEQGIDYDDIYEIGGMKYQSQLKIYATSMTEHQNKGYQLAKTSVRKNVGKSLGDSDRIEKGSDFSIPERQASNFVFPDGYSGNGEEKDKTKNKVAIPEDDASGSEDDIDELENVASKEKKAFKRYVTVKGDTFTASEELKPWLKDLRYIKSLGCKFAEIINLVKNEPGNCFVYGEYVSGSGLITLALCLEGMGFTRYNESGSMFTGMGPDTVKPVCSGAEAEASTRKVRADIKPALRYAIYTKATSDSKFQSMMEAMNSYENRHGDYIKVFLTSRVGRDGININNVLQIHLVGSEWNQSTSYQAISRGLRATSQDDLLAEERIKAIQRGEDPENVVIPVKIYKHAAVPLDDSNLGIDLQMYRISEYKDRTIKRLMRIMKQCAIGCQIHYQRNVRDTDVDGSPTCDYDTCRYQCVDPAPDYVDYSTYDVLYSEETIKDVINELINIYRQKNSQTLKELALLLPQYRDKYLITALEKIITNKVALIDRFGYTTYLREDKGIFYLDRSYPIGTPSSYPMSYYTQGIIAISQKELSEIVVDFEFDENQEVVVNLENMDLQSQEFKDALDNLSVPAQIKVVEEVISRAVNGENSEFIDIVLEKFQRMIFQFNEPITELKKLQEEMAQNKPKRGRKPNPNTKKRIKKINPISFDESKIVRDEDTEPVYLHILYSQVMDQTSYAVTARYNKAEGRIRILKSSEQRGWRDLNETEQVIYNAFIQIEIAKRGRQFEDLGTYGSILSDKLFRVHNRLTQTVGADADIRRINRGKICVTWDRQKLVDVLWDIGIPEPAGESATFREDNRPYLIQVLMRNKVNKKQDELLEWPLKRLVYYYKWYVANTIKRYHMCELIKEEMIRTNKLMT